jgi:hypothetical protein
MVFLCREVTQARDVGGWQAAAPRTPTASLLAPTRTARRLLMRFSYPLALALVLTLTALGSTSRADQIIQTGSFPYAATDWALQGSAQKFDSSLGTLVSVGIVLTGDMLQTMQAENKSPTPKNLTLKGTGTVTMSSGTQVLAVALPTTTRTFAAGPYDGSDDYTGTSGITYPNEFGTNTDNKLYTAPSILSLFVGAGNILFDFTAESTYQVTGSGNLISQASTTADSSYQVIYNYTQAVAAVPEPSTLAMGLTGLVLTSTVAGRRFLRRPQAA